MKTLQRITIFLSLASWISIVVAQDYIPLMVGNEWIYEIYDGDGIRLGTDSMRCEGSYASGDTVFFEFVNYITFTGGSGEYMTERNLFYNGISDPNTVYIRTFMDENLFTDLKYFKHTYSSGQTYGEDPFQLTPLFLGDYSVPYGSFSDCYFLKIGSADSTGLIVAPDVGLIGTMEKGKPVYALTNARLVSISESEKSICEGDSILINDSYVKLSGEYTDTLEAANGVDSIDIVNLSVIPSYEVKVDTSICEGEIYPAGGMDQSASGIYYDTLTTVSGCDSLIITQLTVDLCASTYPVEDPGEAFYIFPNPTAGILQIYSSQVMEVEVYNLFGSKILHSQNHMIDLQTFPNGCYFVKCICRDGETRIRKILLRH